MAASTDAHHGAETALALLLLPPALVLLVPSVLFTDDVSFESMLEYANAFPVPTPSGEMQ